MRAGDDVCDAAIERRDGLTGETARTTLHSRPTKGMADPLSAARARHPWVSERRTAPRGWREKGFAAPAADRTDRPLESCAQFR